MCPIDVIFETPNNLLFPPIPSQDPLTPPASQLLTPSIPDCLPLALQDCLPPVLPETMSPTNNSDDILVLPDPSTLFKTYHVLSPNLPPNNQHLTTPDSLSHSISGPDNDLSKQEIQYLQDINSQKLQNFKKIPTITKQEYLKSLTQASKASLEFEHRLDYHKKYLKTLITNGVSYKANIFQLSLIEYEKNKEEIILRIK